MLSLRALNSSTLIIGKMLATGWNCIICPPSSCPALLVSQMWQCGSRPRANARFVLAVALPIVPIHCCNVGNVACMRTLAQLASWRLSRLRLHVSFVPLFCANHFYEAPRYVGHGHDSSPGVIQLVVSRLRLLRVLVNIPLDGPLL